MHRIIEHTADLGLRVRSQTLEGLVHDAACGLFEIIAGDLTQIRPDRDERFRITGTDPERLLFDWLRELHAAFELRRMLFREFEVAIDSAGIRALAHGERYDPVRHTLAHEIKAVTWHELSVRHAPTGWEASIFVDV
ncbi:MAG: archease [Planctomycetia bacterium]